MSTVPVPCPEPIQLEPLHVARLALYEAVAKGTEPTLRNSRSSQELDRFSKGLVK